MWKALIKWVESWSYRCEHDWKLICNMEVVSKGMKEAVEYRKTYMCKKCGEHKQIKL